MIHAILAVAILVLSFPARADAPRVVVSIKPIHALVAAVMEGVGEPRLLVPPEASEHSFSLRPSDAKALEAADIVFWVGEELESFLAKSIAALPGRGRVVALAGAPGQSLLELREGGDWEAHDDGHGHGHKHDGKAAAARRESDMHIWLDPTNAGKIVAAAAAALSTVDPANAARYAQNAARAQPELDALDAELDAIFAPIRARPFIVFHDAYRYLERRYGLNAVGSVTVSPERKPSARRMQQIRGKIVRLEAVCVFSEPQFDAGLVRAAIDGTPARTAALDHLGVGAPDGLSGYTSMMRRLAGTFADCLAPPG